MTPEQKSRKQIDRQLEQAGWVVYDLAEINVSSGPGVAVREFPLTTGVADCILYADTKAIGVVKAKAKDHTLTGVETQSGKYLDGLPAGLPHNRLPLSPSPTSPLARSRNSRFIATLIGNAVVAKVSMSRRMVFSL